MISTEKNLPKLYTINIFGSCVSRDILEYSKKNFSVGEYIARESIVSFLSVPVCFEEEKIQLSSTFKKKQLIQDLQKSGIEHLKSNPNDFLIIDFIEERFNIGKINRSYITISSEFVESKIYKEKEFKVYPKKIWHNQVYFRFKNMEKYIHYFAQTLLSIYAQKQLIIHEVYMADQYIDEKGNVCTFTKNYLSYNKRINQILKYMYTCLKAELPDAHIISLKNNYVADKMHKWGLAPMHFQQEYYQSAAKLIFNKIASQERIF